jgi:hypothetical protein
VEAGRGEQADGDSNGKNYRTEPHLNFEVIHEVTHNFHLEGANMRVLLGDEMLLLHARGIKSRITSDAGTSTKPKLPIKMRQIIR